MADMSRARYRERISPPEKSGSQIIGYLQAYYNGQWRPIYTSNSKGDPVYATLPTTYTSAESCVDYLHKKVKGQWTSGAPFRKIKIERAPNRAPQGNGTYDSGSRTLNIFGLGNVKLRYTGGWVNPSFADPYVPSDFSDTSKMLGAISPLVPPTAAWGPEAWARTAPKLEIGSMGTFFAEISEAPAMLATSAAGFKDIWRSLGGGATSFRGYRESVGRHFLRSGLQTPKKVSDHFLNGSFGWAPFVSDLEKFADNNARFFQYYDHLRRNNGQWKHYRRTLLDDVTRTLVDKGTGNRCEPTGYTFLDVICKPGMSRWEVWEEKYTLVTTSGRFKFYIPSLDVANYPDDSPSMAMISAWLRMHGLRVSPSVVWRATPWTWLIDWYGNVGRNLDVITGALYDGVVSDYLYLMHHTESRLVCKQIMATEGGDVEFEWSRKIEVKQRNEAGSPFGFDSPWETLSPWRLAILAALGISKH